MPSGNQLRTPEEIMAKAKLMIGAPSERTPNLQAGTRGVGEVGANQKAKGPEKARKTR